MMESPAALDPSATDVMTNAAAVNRLADASAALTKGRDLAKEQLDASRQVAQDMGKFLNATISATTKLADTAGEFDVKGSVSIIVFTYADSTKSAAKRGLCNIREFKENAEYKADGSPPTSEAINRGRQNLVNIQAGLSKVTAKPVQETVADLQKRTVVAKVAAVEELRKASGQLKAVVDERTSLARQAAKQMEQDIEPTKCQRIAAGVGAGVVAGLAVGACVGVGHGVALGLAVGIGVTLKLTQVISKDWTVWAVYAFGITFALSVACGAAAGWPAALLAYVPALVLDKIAAGLGGAGILWLGFTIDYNSAEVEMLLKEAQTAAEVTIANANATNKACGDFLDALNKLQLALAGVDGALVESTRGTEEAIPFLDPAQFDAAGPKMVVDRAKCLEDELTTLYELAKTLRKTVTAEKPFMNKIKEGVANMSKIHLPPATDKMVQLADKNPWAIRVMIASVIASVWRR